MLKIFRSVLGFCLICGLQASAYSASKLYKLIPGKSLVMTNTVNVPVSAYCAMSAVSTEINTIKVTMLQGSGQVNGTSLRRGETIYQTVYNTQYIAISANIGASASFTNIGSSEVQALCDLG